MKQSGLRLRWVPEWSFLHENDAYYSNCPYIIHRIINRRSHADENELNYVVVRMDRLTCWTLFLINEI